MQNPFDALCGNSVVKNDVMFLQDSTEEDPSEKNGIAYEDQLENFVKMSRRRPTQNNA
jgi:hypothetical protein